MMTQQIQKCPKFLSRSWQILSQVNRLLPRSLFALSKTFFDKSKPCSRRLAPLLHFVRKLALRAQTVQIADLLLRQELLAKNVLMTAQRNSCLGNSPSRADPTFHRENVKSVGLSLFSLEFLLVALRGGKLPKTSLGQNG